MRRSPEEGMGNIWPINNNNPMKKHTILSLTASIGTLLLASCGNSGSSGTMQEPIAQAGISASADAAARTQVAEAAMPTDGEAAEQEVREASEDRYASAPGSISGTPALATRAKNTLDMLDAFKGETTATAKYAAYAKKAEAEGYHAIALLFAAASRSEGIHAANHRSVLEDEGTAIPATTPEFTVKSTLENLQDAIAGETYEQNTMYPQFMAVADAAGDKMALLSLNYAYKTEQKHKVFYEKALAALQGNTVAQLPTVYYVCPTCGNTYDTNAPKRCGISMTKGERFIKISTLAGVVA
jgi:rubrerythrin